MAAYLGHNPLSQEELRTAFTRARDEGNDYLIRYMTTHDTVAVGGLSGARVVDNAASETHDEVVATTEHHAYETLLGIYKNTHSFNVTGVFNLKKEFEQSDCTADFKQTPAYTRAARKVEYLQSVDDYAKLPFVVQALTIPKALHR